ncbi:MAG: hypothetical protein MST03_04990 [Bacteroidales bacterium]|nr:hypothetical protein [Bacteroidales bacterium]
MTTYTAEFEGKKVTVSTAVGSNGGGSVSDGGAYDCNSSITLKATPDACHQFKQWSVTQNGQTSTITPNGTTCQTDPTTGINTLTVTVDGPATYTAEFEKKQVTITGIVSGCSGNDDCGTIVGANQDYPCGEPVTLTAVARGCYDFSHWADDNSNTNPREFDAPAENATYEAVFVQKDPFYITVAVDQDNHGEVYIETGAENPLENPVTEKQFYCDEGFAVLVAVPYECSTFKEWHDSKGKIYRPGTGTGSGTTCVTNADGSNTLTVPLEGAETYTAVFTGTTYKIEASIQEGSKDLGTITIIKDDNFCQDPFYYTLRAEPDGCATFVKWINTETHEEFVPGDSHDWSIDAENGKYDLIIHQPASATYEAVFEEKDPVKVTVYTADSDKGTVSIE